MKMLLIGLVPLLGACGTHTDAPKADSKPGTLEVIQLMGERYQPLVGAGVNSLVGPYTHYDFPKQVSCIKHSAYVADPMAPNPKFETAYLDNQEALSKFAPTDFNILLATSSNFKKEKVLTDGAIDSIFEKLLSTDKSYVFIRSSQRHQKFSFLNREFDAQTYQSLLQVPAFFDTCGDAFIESYEFGTQAEMLLECPKNYTDELKVLANDLEEGTAKDKIQAFLNKHPEAICKLYLQTAGFNAKGLPDALASVHTSKDSQLLKTNTLPYLNHMENAAELMDKPEIVNQLDRSIQKKYLEKKLSEQYDLLKNNGDMNTFRHNLVLIESCLNKSSKTAPCHDW